MHQASRSGLFLRTRVGLHTLKAATCPVAGPSQQTSLVERVGISSTRTPSLGMDTLAIGVDVGGTHVLAVLMDPSGCIHARHEARLAAEDRSSQQKIVAVIGSCVVQVSSGLKLLKDQACA